MKFGSHPSNIKLIEYVERQLSDAEAQAIGEHLAGCNLCRNKAKDFSESANHLKTLPLIRLPASAEERIKTAMRGSGDEDSTGRIQTHIFRRWAAVAAVLVVGCTSLVLHYQNSRDGIELHFATWSKSPFEQTATQLHEAQTENRVRFDYSGNSPEQARRWIKQNLDIDADIAAVRPPEDGSRYRLQGVKAVKISGVPAVLVAYQVDKHPVTLLTAKAAKIAGVPPRSYLTKRVFYRDNGAYKSLSWNSAGQAYTLVSDLPQLAHESCYICHTGRRFRDRIDKMHLEK